MFLGYCSTSKGYRCYDPVLDKVFVSRHVRFEENYYPYSSLTQFSHTQTFSYTSSFSIPLTYFDEIVVSVPVLIVSSSIPSASPQLLPPSSFVQEEQVSPSGEPAAVPVLQSPSGEPTAVPVLPSSVIPATTSSIPSTISSSNHLSHHPMQTRSKSGIFKPRHPMHFVAQLYLTLFLNLKVSKKLFHT